MHDYSQACSQSGQLTSAWGNIGAVSNWNTGLVSIVLAVVVVVLVGVDQFGRVVRLLALTI